MAKGRGDTVEKLFSPKRQYEIPIYQRRYVWDIENWDALWTDIQEKYVRRLNGDKRTSHFTGIIITRKDEKGQGLPKYQILDGQQRLTTFQIILCVIRDLCQSANYTLRKESADLLLKNEEYKEKYKLSPKEGFDERAFHHLVDSKSRCGHVMHRAYNHFMDAIINDVGTDFQNIDHLYNAITNDFHMVQIDLKKGDEPEKIFASLNATGRMLDEFDHLRNDLFLKAGEDGDNLYRTCWRHFDTDIYWENPENLDKFLCHFLQATVKPECFRKEEGKDIKAFDVYLKQYRPKLKPDQNINYEFRKLKRYSRVYQEMNEPNSKIGSRMMFYKEFDIEGIFPFLLFIISEFSEFTFFEDEYQRKYFLSDTDLVLIFDILESYMIRRMLRWGQDHHYKSIDHINSFFNICISQESFSLPKFIANMANPSLERHQDKWSTDTEVNAALNEQWHAHIEKGIRYILYRIEKKIRGEERETLDFTDELRLERIMPTKWEYSLNWQLPLEEGSDRCVPYDNMFSEEHKKNNKSWRKAFLSEEGLIDQSYSYALNMAKKRRKCQKSIGNLTLVDVEIDTDQLSEKKSYFEEFHLEINEVVYKSEIWDAPQIEERAQKLLPHFHELWPSSKYFMETYLSRKYPIGSTVQGKVLELKNSGVLLELENGIEGWIPKNEITWTPYVDLRRVVNTDDEIKAVVTKIIKPKDTMRILLSMKPFLIEPWSRLEQEYPIGSEVSGLIRKITSHGVYVEIEDGITGKLDYSEFSWLNDRMAGTFLNEGDKIDVIIQNIDPSKGKITLNFKQTPQNPWEQIEKKYPIGARVKGRIRNITDYGAFVEIEDGIDGLLHNSELSWTNRNVSSHDFFNMNDIVEVVILRIDTSEQNITLGHKQLELNPWEHLKEKYPVGMKIKRRIRELTDFGAYVKVEEGIDGLIRNSDLSWLNRKATARELLDIDVEFEVVVLEIKESEKQVLLGVKQLEQDPWELMEQEYPVGTEITGHVQKLTKSGAYVKTKEGLNGLIRNSDISWTNFKVAAQDFFKVDDEVKTVILEIDSSKQLIYLGCKQLQPNPWKHIENKYSIGTEVKGHVQNITNFGVFIEIEEGIEGLIHISELTDKEIESPEDIVSVGEELKLKVIQVSSKDQRIGLSLRAMITDETKNQPQWISMIDSQTIVFTTYQGRKQLSDVEVREPDVIGLDSNDKKTTVNIKKDILFAYSKKAYPKLVYHITKRISDQEQKFEQFHIQDVDLKAAQNTHSVVTVIIHSGYELKGIVEGLDKEVIYMQINNENVIVFRHSICDFKFE